MVWRELGISECCRVTRFQLGKTLQRLSSSGPVCRYDGWPAKTSADSHCRASQYRLVLLQGQCRGEHSPPNHVCMRGRRNQPDYARRVVVRVCTGVTNPTMYMCYAARTTTRPGLGENAPGWAHSTARRTTAQRRLLDSTKRRVSQNCRCLN
jgi:hypothetical protein